MGEWEQGFSELHVSGSKRNYSDEICCCSGSEPNKRSKAAAAPELPEHLHYSILLLLPVKSLLRFRSVSKQWNEMITSRSFSMDRISHPSRTEPAVSSILSYERDAKIITQISVNKICVENNCQPLKPRQLCLPFQVIFVSPSSCDGLSLVSYYSCSRKESCYIRIWNSFTDVSRDVSWPEGFDTEDPIFMGFGYDFKSQDYKVVMMAVASRESNKFEIQVTSLKSNVWRKVDASMSAIPPLNSVSAGRYHDSVTVGEDIYWIAGTKSENDDEIDLIESDFHSALLKFNVAEEKLTSISLPQEVISGERNKEFKLGRHNGTLLLYTYEQDWRFAEDGPAPIDIWMQHNGNGNKSVWQKVLSIPKPSPYMGHTIPLGITREGNFIFMVWEGMGLKEYIVKQGRHIDLEVDRNLSRIVRSWLLDQISFVDTETLISP